MINKYNNPRLFNTVLTGPGMEHPRNPHVVIGSDTKGFIQGDLMDANAIMETIDQKIDADNLIDQEKLTTAINNVLGDVSTDHDTLKEVEDDLTGIHEELLSIAILDNTLNITENGTIKLVPEGDGTHCCLVINNQLIIKNESHDPGAGDAYTYYHIWNYNIEEVIGKTLSQALELDNILYGNTQNKTYVETNLFPILNCDSVILGSQVLSTATIINKE